MKRLFLLVVCCLCGLNVFSQKKIDSWSCSYFNKEYDIECSSLNEKGEFDLYIEISGESSTRKANLNIASNNIPLLIEFLSKIKDKYEEWGRIAKENNVSDTSKDMDFISPRLTVCWFGSKWWFSFNQRLTPKFIVLNDGTSVVSMYKKVSSSSNEYIDQKVYWVFNSTSEIGELINKIQPERLLEKLKEEKKASDLFK